MASGRKHVGIAKCERECTQSCCEGRAYDTLCHTRRRFAQHALSLDRGLSLRCACRVYANPVAELERVHLRQ